MRYRFGSSLTAAMLLAGGIGAAALPAQAQQGMMRDSYSPFTERSNATALNRALLMRQMERGTPNTGTSGDSSGSGTAYVNNYSSQTVGNLNNISQILDGGAEAYISTGQDQHGTQSSGTQGNQNLQVQHGNTSTTGLQVFTPTPSGAGGNTGAPQNQVSSGAGH